MANPKTPKPLAASPLPTVATTQAPAAPATPATPVLTAAQQAAHAAAVAAGLPRSLVALATRATPVVVPPALQALRLLPGRPYAARGHNAAWAAAVLAAAAAPGGCTMQQAAAAAAAAGSPAGGLHSAKAYYSRGWLVAAK